jgi:hypothetical protein
MAITTQYRFEECSCINVGGAKVMDPGRIWPVLERDDVTAIADRRILNPQNGVFQLWSGGLYQLIEAENINSNPRQRTRASQHSFRPPRENRKQ